MSNSKLNSNEYINSNTKCNQILEEVVNKNENMSSKHECSSNSSDCYNNCFFHIVIKNFQEFFDKDITVKSLKSKYYDFIKNNSDKSFGETSKMTIKKFIVDNQIKINTSENDDSIFDEYLHCVKADNFEGRSNVEGRILAEIFDVRFHLRELIVISISDEENLTFIWSDQIVHKISEEVIVSGNTNTEADVKHFLKPTEVTVYKLLDSYKNSWDLKRELITRDKAIIEKFYVTILRLPLNYSVVSLHKAFCNIISTSNITIANSFINLINNKKSTVDFELILSKSYSELIHQEIILSEEMKVFVENKLCDLQFCVKKIFDFESTDFIKGKIEETCMMVKNLDCYEGVMGKEVDWVFLCTGQLIARNLTTLKRQIKATYEKFPWEEIEFCLIIFLKCYLKPEQVDEVFRLVLDKDRILLYLNEFCENIKGMSDFSGEINQKLKKTRIEIVKNISENSVFEMLYRDYEVVRNVFSLKKIEHQIELAINVDLQNNSQLGQLVIERTLQVIGENLKNTLESPKISDRIHQLFLAYAPKNLKKNMTQLRDSLSHVQTVSQNMEIEKERNLQIFYNIQNDLKKILLDLKYILFQQKIEGVKLFLDKLIRNAEISIVIKDLISATSKNENELENFSLTEYLEDQNEVDKIKDFIKCIVRLDTTKLEFNFNLIQIINSCIKENYVRKNGFVSSPTFEDFYQRWSNSFGNNLTNDNRNKLKLVLFKIILIKLIKKGIEEKNHEICEMLNNIKNLKLIKNILIGLQNFEWNNNLNENKDYYEINKIRNLSRTLRNAIDNCYEHESAAFDKINELFDQMINENVNLKENYQDTMWELCDWSNIFYTKNIKFILKTAVDLKNDILLEETIRIKTIDQIHDKFIEIENSLKNRNSFSNNIEEIINFIYITINFEINRINHIEKMNKMKPKTKKKSDTSEKQNSLKTSITILNNLIGQKNTVAELIKIDNVLWSALEMLLLKILEISNDVGDNKFFFYEFCPVLTGSNLRNYLAHGDTLIDLLPFNTKVAISNCILKFLNNKTISSTKVLKKSENISTFQTILDTIKIQSEFYSILKNNSLRDLLEWFGQNKGVRSSKLLEYAIQNSDFEILKYCFQNLTWELNNNNIYNFFHTNVLSFKYFIEKNIIQKNFRCKDGKSLLHYAALRGNADIFQILLDNKIYDSCDKSGKTSLYYAVQNGHLQIVIKIINKFGMSNIDNALYVASSQSYEDVVKYLIENNADVNFRESDTSTPLHKAANNGHLNIVKCLIENNADVNLGTNLNITALHFASQNDHLEVVKYLIQSNAKVNTVSKNDNRTPLFIAAVNGNYEIVDYLLKSGANPNIGTNNRTALYMASQNGHFQVVKKLIQYKANVNGGTTSCNYTSLHIASQLGYLDIVKYLVQNDAIVNSRSNDGETALYLASLFNHLDIAKYLVENKADVNIGTEECETPLYAASQNGHIDVVKYLIEKNANIEATTKVHQNTSLHIAVQKGHLNVVNYLLENKAKVNVSSRPNNETALHIASQLGDLNVVKCLLKNDANVNATKNYNITALHLASVFGHLEIVNTLLKHKANVNAVSDDNVTALFVATESGNLQMVKYLIEKKADVNICTATNNSVLHIASRKGDLNLVKCLIEDTKVAKDIIDVATNDSKLTALHIATLNGDVDIVEHLIKKGANVNSSVKTTALYMAAEHGFLNIVKCLIENKADINAVSQYNFTPLHVAAYKNHLPVIEYLLQNGANINAVTDDNFTALNVASEYGHLEIVKYLVKNNANVNISSNIDNCSPLLNACKKGHVEALKYLVKNKSNVNATISGKNFSSLHLASQNGNLDIVKYLIQSNADINIVTNDNFTALHIACANGHLSVVNYLIKSGADVKSFANDNLTPLFLASQNGHLDVVKTLILHKADVTACAFGKDVTPLQIASLQGHLEVVKCLISNKSNINVMTKETNSTALHAAAKVGHFEIVKCLVENGANVNASTSDSNCTALDFANQNKHSEIVEYLIKHNANFRQN